MNMKSGLLVGFVFLGGAFLLPADAEVRYVSPFGGNVPPYTNWAMAAQHIQTAISASAEGDIVLVTNGVYGTGGAVVFGAMTNRIAITNRITVKSVNGAAFTAIAGQGPLGSQAIRCAWVASNAVLDGFTLTNGFTLAEGDSVRETCGGGVWCEYNGAIVSNCVITACSAANGGGGFYGGRIVNTVVSNNTAVFGGGGEASSADLVDHCVIVFNRSVRDGGGMYSGVGLRNSHVAGNIAGERGGGLYGVWNAESCTVVGNSAQEGGGVCGVTISNSIIYYNTDQFGSPNYLGNVTYSCTTPDPGTAGNLTNAPGLAGLWNPHLVTNSPCVDAGTNSGWMASAVDVDGEPRLAGRVDMGCDEVVATGMVLSLSPTVLSADCTNTVVGMPIRFHIEIRNRPVRFSWMFGDGQGVDNQTVVEHAYSQPGTYVVTNRVWNRFGYLEVTKGIQVHAGYTNHVAKGGSDTPPYDTWAKAASNLQQAVDACAKGGTVLVSNGVYNTGGVEWMSSNRVAITNRMTVRSMNGALQTVILGVPSTGLDAMRGAYVGNGSRLEGFTLANGRSRGASVPLRSISETLGGGVYVEAGAVLVDCVISNNGALNGGGACGWGTFERCTLADNSANNSGGGALYGYFRNCTIGPENAAKYGAGLSQAEADSCGIYTNRASEFGGGMSYGVARRCHLEGNVANNYSSSGVGGGAYYATLENCQVLWNRARIAGGGTYASTVRHCTIRGNDVLSGAGGGAYGGAIISSIIWQNYNAMTVDNVFLSSGSLDYSCTSPELAGTGNTTNDPQFVNDFLGDYRLIAGSPCIDKGDPLSTVSNDYGGVARPLDGNADGTNTVDMGAHEFANAAVDQDGDGLSDAQEAYTFGTNPRRADTDGDAQGDGAEVVAGTNPLDEGDYFAWRQTAPASSGYLVSWDSATGRLYRVESAPAVTGMWAGVSGATNLPGTGSRMTLTNAASAPWIFHRVNVWRP